LKDRIVSGKTDTRPDAERVQIELMRQAPSWCKLELLGQLSQTVKILAASGLRQRYPDATERELRRRLADLMLGTEMAARVYGPKEEDHVD